MKVIECVTEERSERLPAPLDLLRQLLERKTKSHTPPAVINVLQKYLDNRYTLLFQVPVGDVILGIRIPLVLAGPQGVWVINSQDVRGVFRLSGETWEQMDSRRQGYQPGMPDLAAQTREMAAALAQALGEAGQSPPVEAVLYFANPSAHVEAVAPAVRLVLADGLERFLVSMLQRPAMLSAAQVEQVAASLAGEAYLRGSATSISQDIFSFREAPKPKPVTQVVVDHSEPEFAKKIPFSKRQWIFLGLLLIINVVLLSTFVLIVLQS